MCFVEYIRDLSQNKLKSGVLARKRARVQILENYGDLLEQRNKRCLSLEHVHALCDVNATEHGH